MTGLAHPQRQKWEHQKRSFRENIGVQRKFLEPWWSWVKGTWVAFMPLLLRDNDSGIASHSLKHRGQTDMKCSRGGGRLICGKAGTRIRVLAIIPPLLPHTHSLSAMVLLRGINRGHLKGAALGEVLKAGTTALCLSTWAHLGSFMTTVSWLVRGVFPTVTLVEVTSPGAMVWFL